MVEGSSLICCVDTSREGNLLQAAGGRFARLGEERGTNTDIYIKCIRRFGLLWFRMRCYAGTCTPRVDLHQTLISAFCTQFVSAGACLEAPVEAFGNRPHAVFYGGGGGSLKRELP